MPIEIFKLFQLGERGVAENLVVLTSRTLLFAYWISFFTAAVLSTARTGPLWAVGMLAQALLLIVWFGYPLTILYAVVPTHIGRIGALALAAGVMGAVGLVAYSEAHQADSRLISLAVFALVFAPFVAGGYGLRIAERRADVTTRTSMFVSIIAFIFLPFLATFIHGRVATALRSTQRTSL